MADVNANINILINTQGATGALRTLQSQISQFNRSIAAGNAGMAASQKALTSNLAAQIAATNAFSTSFQKVETNASRLQTAIDKNRLSLGEYFRYGIASSGAFGRVFQKEHNEVMDLAADRVKRLQTQYLALGRAQNGMVDTMAVRPLQLHNADAAVGVQRQQLFNKLLRDGATSMVNWGKNTQWAGRQLMVGFTVPLTIFGGYAASIFMDLDKQITQFKRVYGDAMTPTAEADAMVSQIQDLAKEYTKYGITVADSIEMASKAAATGLQGADLMAATEEALRLATLGQIDYQQALDATISLQSAFDISSQDLANTIDFLNATENQTIVSLDDISQAIPRVAPVIKGLGGDVRDLAAMLAAMREGGVNAAEGANALKSGLASLINPSKQANEVLSDMGINLEEIVKTNEGDLMGTVQDFARAIQDLSNLDRQKALATLFGKYQFARMGALFKNIIRDGSQAQRVMELAGMSVQELAALSEKDLSRLEESVSVKFLGAFERLKLAIAPIGEEFLKIATPIIEWVTSIFEKFNDLSPEVKKWGLIIVGALGAVLPILVMVAGLFGNFLGNIVKGAAILKGFFSRVVHGGRSIGYMEGEMLDAVAASNSLEGATNGVTQALNVQRSAVIELANAYQKFLNGARQALLDLPKTITTPTVTSGRQGPPSAPPPIPPPTTGPRPSGPRMGPPPTPAEWTTGQSNIKAAMYMAHFADRASLSKDEIATLLADPKVLKSAKQNMLKQLGMVPDDIARFLTDVSERAKVSSDDALAFARAQIDPFEKQVMGYTNQVLAVSRDFEKANIPVEAMRRDLVTNRQAAFTKLAMALKQRGLSDPEIFRTIDSIGSRISQTLDAQATKLVYTQEEMYRVVQNALDDVSRADARVRQAVGDISRVSAVADANAQGRASLYGAGDSRQAYNKQRAEIYADMLRRIPAEQMPFQTSRSAVTFVTAMDDSIRRMGVSLDVVRRGWDALSAEAQIALVSMMDDSERFTQEFIAQMRNLASQTGAPGAEAARAFVAAFDAGVNGAVLMEDTVAEMGGAAGAAGRAGAAAAGAAGAGAAAGGRRPTVAPNDPDRIWVVDENGNARVTTRSELERGQQTRPTRRPTVSVSGQDFKDSQSQRAQQTLEDAAEGLDKETKKSGGLISRGASAFGKSLLQGSGKLQGGLFALDGLVFGLSFLDNQIGEFANKIMPAIFAFQGITMLLPLLANPIGAVVLAAAALAGGIFAANMAFDNMRNSAQDMADALISTSSTINKVGEFFGRESLVQQAQTAQATRTAGVESDQITQAREFLQTDVGQEIFNGLQSAIQDFGSAGAAEQFAANLSTMILQGVINEKEARAIAAVVGEQLGDERFGIQVIGEMKQIIGPNGKDIKQDPVRVALEIDSRNRKVIDDLKSQVTGMGDFIGQQLEIGFSDFFYAYDMFGGGLKGALAMLAGGGTLGWINIASKELADWPNFIGDAAKWVAGKLNPELEKAYENASQFGSAIGNNVVQSYENVLAVQERVLTLEEQLQAAKDANAKKSTKQTRQQLDEARTLYNRSASQQNQLLANQQDFINQTIADFRNPELGLFRMEDAVDQWGGVVKNGKQVLSDTGRAIVDGLDVALNTMFEGASDQLAALNMLNFEQAQLASTEVYLKLNISAGTYTPTELNQLIGLFNGKVDQVAQYTMNVVTKFGGDTQAAGDIIGAIMGAGFNDMEWEQKFLTIIQSEGLTVDELKLLTTTLNELAYVEDENLKKVLSVDALGMTEKEVKQLNKTLYEYNGLPAEMQKVAGLAYEEYGVEGFSNAVDNVKAWQNIQDQDLEKKAKITAVMDEFNVAKQEAKEFINADEEKKISMLVEWSNPSLEGVPDGIKPDTTGQSIVEVQVETTGVEEADTEITDLQNKANTDQDFLVDVDTTDANTELDNLILKATTPQVMQVNVVYNDPGYQGTGASASSAEGPFEGGLIGSKGQYPGNTRKFATGGMAGLPETGGQVPGDGGRDSVLALLAPGEFVMRKRAVDQYGEQFFRMLNMGAYFGGGKVLGGIKRFHKGGKNDKGDNDGKDGKKDYDEADTNKDGEVSDAERKEEDIKNALKDFKDSLDEIIKTYIDINGSLKDFINGSLTVTKAVIKGSGLQQMLSKAGLNQAMIDQVMGMGIDAAKRWYKQYTNAAGKLTKEGLGQLRAMMAGFIIEQMGEYQARFAEAQAQRGAFNAATANGAGSSVALEIAGSPESSQAYMMLIKEQQAAQEKLEKARKSGKRKEIKKAEEEYNRAANAVKKYERSVRNALDAEDKLAKKIEDAQRVLDKMAEFAERRATAEAQTRAANVLRREGADQELVEEIAGDPEAAKAYNTLLEEQARAQRQLDKARKSGKGLPRAKRAYADAQEAVNAYERRVRKAMEAEEALAKALDPVGWAIDQIDKNREDSLNKFGLAEAKFAKAFGELERAARPGIKAAQELVKAKEKIVEGIQDEIEKQQRLNEDDQARVRLLDRQKEMIQRQVDALEELNEKDQRKIENLQREDELRNRVAEKLERDLDQLGKQEQKVEEAYQQRIDALNKVSEMNQRIVDQQKSMLDISKSLSEGDIYAAAQAVQERRGQQAQYAAEQAQTALEGASANAIKNLRTADGLTREEAEARVEAIREQSYQTSLKIRDIEDEIYKRNQLMIPIMDQMKTIDTQILAIQDAMFNRETTIINLQNTQLRQAEDALEAAQKDLTMKEEALENDKASLEIDGLTYEQLQDQISAEAEAYDLAVALVKVNEDNVAAIENIVRKWEDVGAAISKANRLAREGKEEASGVARRRLNIINQKLEKGEITKRQAEERKNQVRTILKNKLDAIEAKRRAAIDAAIAEGQRRQQAISTGQYYKGGMIKKYGVGDMVAGDGSRDSVSALLTPGEFVMRKAAVDKYGAGTFRAMNMGSFAMPSYRIPSSPSSVSSSPTRVSNNNTFAPVYNSYGINVNVNGTNASADEIANRTLAKIHEMQSMTVRSARV